MNALRKYRENAMLTKKELALKMGVSQACVNQWERGKRYPDVVSLKKLAVILGCTADQLLEDINMD